MANAIQIYFDGLCEPKNPGGIPVYAFIVYDSDSGRILGQEAGLAGEPWSRDVTHNLAEYTGAIKSSEVGKGALAEARTVDLRRFRTRNQPTEQDLQGKVAENAPVVR